VIQVVVYGASRSRRTARSCAFRSRSTPRVTSSRANWIVTPARTASSRDARPSSRVKLFRPRSPLIAPRLKSPHARLISDATRRIRTLGTGPSASSQTAAMPKPHQVGPKTITREGISLENESAAGVQFPRHAEERPVSALYPARSGPPPTAISSRSSTERESLCPRMTVRASDARPHMRSSSSSPEPLRAEASASVPRPNECFHGPCLATRSQQITGRCSGAEGTA